jgi:predicted amino acid dehydrogenase
MSKLKKLGMFLGLILTLAAVLVVWSAGNADTSEIDRNLVRQPTDLDDLVAPAEIDETVTKENYDKIKNGMRREDVEALFAMPDSLISSKQLKGKLTEAYRWESEDTAKNIEVTFVQNKVVSKTQKGLT